MPAGRGARLPIASAIATMGWPSTHGTTAIPDNTTHPVGEKKPNAWGLYDMHGNVWEWCQDWYAKYPTGAATDPQGPAQGDVRVLRGGSWDLNPANCRSAIRSYGFQDIRYANSFRVVVGTASRTEAGVVWLSTQPATKASTNTEICQVALPVDTLDLGGGVKLEVVLIPAGKFIMGSQEREKLKYNNAKPHEVTISHPFYMGKYVVTQDQYLEVMKNNPSIFKGMKNPVEHISWNDTKWFCKRVSEKSGKTVRLPTEAEWEYACRAGSTSEVYFSNSESLDDYAWYSYNSNGTTHAVGEKKPNAWGLYDMYGNVTEWCQDWYGEYATGAATDPTGPGPANDAGHVLRGGAWQYNGASCQSTSRNHGNDSDYHHYHYVGFRVVVGAASKTP